MKKVIMYLLIGLLLTIIIVLTVPKTCAKTDRFVDNLPCIQK